MEEAHPLLIIKNLRTIFPRQRFGVFRHLSTGIDDFMNGYKRIHVTIDLV